jgi:Na+/H+ antiporter NhaD/arsenite permease-like protein
LAVLGIMVVGFVMHNRLGWEPWFVTAIGLTALVFIGKDIDMEEAFAHTELALLMFFISLFIIVGGVEHSQFLEFLGTFIVPYVQSDLLMATIMLMWISAVLSAAIDNIPFTAAMIPIILGMEAQGINVTPLWWGLAAGVGMGGGTALTWVLPRMYLSLLSLKKWPKMLVIQAWRLLLGCGSERACRLCL